MSKFAGLVVLLLLAVQLTAQTPGKIKVNAHKTPLDQVLLDLKAKYGFQFAFDSDLLAKYPVTLNRTFNSEEATVKYLVRNLPLAVEKSGDVFLIIPQQEAEPPPLPVYRISGQVLEINSNEPLPYSNVVINQRPVQSDQQGHFNYIASADTGFNVQISHLGYFIYDTIVYQSIQKKFYLIPRIERIEEVQVLSNPIEKSTLIGDQAGRMKINHQIAPILPGHGDNSVFNLLRLMPGVLAAGEQSNDLLIWGAYESHSKVQFDGFTVFGLKNFNDNISVVNPFMVKNMEVMKGAYEARYGDRVGGIVDIAGKDGTLLKPTLELNINSTTVNSMLQVPLSKRASLIAAYRQTYYQLYDPTQLSFFQRKDHNVNNPNANPNSQTQKLNFDVTPDFTFRDANLKYTYKHEDGTHFALSLYGGGDSFMYDMESEISRFILRRTEEEKNRQYGGSFQLNRPWINGDATNITLAYSAFEQQSSEENTTENTRMDVERTTKLADSHNSVDEIRVNIEHTLNFEKGHKLLLAAGGMDNHVQLTRMLNEEPIFDLDNRMPRLHAYIQDELPLGKLLGLKTGIRVVYATGFKAWYLEPRASASLQIAEGMKLNAAWGIYHQFTAKTTLLDSAYNFSTFWVNANNEAIPVLSAQHFVGGLAFDKNGWSASVEGYYKTTDGLTRYFNENKRFDRGFYQGNARSYGLDLFLKKEYKRHMAWISYTLSQTEEHFPLYVREYYQPAPQHQKHEVKFAGVLNYKRFYLSANYVYGSGFERFDIETENGIKLNQPYNRLDAALVYKFKPGKVKAEAGISVLNVLNADNIKYSNLSITSVEEISLVGVYADAIPFTPALFLKIEL